MFPKYFLQTKTWSDFWQENNDSPHKVLEFQLTKLIDKRRITLRTLVYQYPWHLGQIFWYIPKGFFLVDENENTIDWNCVDVEDLEKMLVELIGNIQLDAKKNNIIYIKIDFEEELTKWLNFENQTQIVEFLQHYLSYKCIPNTKIIQYLATITLDIKSNLETKNKTLEINKSESNSQNSSQISSQSLLEFFNSTQTFWKTTNSNVRRYTKKSLEQNWEISVEKTESNFEAFWAIYNYTKDKHNFAIQTKEYCRSLFDKEFSRVIIISRGGAPQGVWLGIVIEDTVTYLYGGNTDLSYENYGQYLIHLVAVNLGTESNCNYYDLGGYDPNKGFGKFKENYKGTIRNFLGPIDMVINPLKYRFIDSIIKLAKLVKR